MFKKLAALCFPFYKSPMKLILKFVRLNRENVTKAESLYKSDTYLTFNSILAVGFVFQGQTEVDLNTNMSAIIRAQV